MKRLKDKTAIALTAIFLTLLSGCTTRRNRNHPQNRKNQVLSSIRQAANRFRKISKEMKWSALRRVRIFK